MELYQIIGLLFLVLLAVIVIVSVIRYVVNIHKNGVPRETKQSKKWNKFQIALIVFGGVLGLISNLIDRGISITSVIIILIIITIIFVFYLFKIFRKH